MAIKFNNGNTALICDTCSRILAVGADIPKKAFESDTVWVCDEECAIRYHKMLDKRMYIIPKDSSSRFTTEQIIYQD